MRSLALIVSQVGEKVKKFKVGDRVGVGALVGSCCKCDTCRRREEQYCPRQIPTYNSGSPGSFGGYSQNIVVNQDFVLNIPESIELAAAAPLLFAGITMGIGDLGHMALKFSKALGFHTEVASISAKNEEKAWAVGADGFVFSRTKENIAKARNKYDVILDTISTNHDIPAALRMLKTNGRLVLVGLLPEPVSNLHSFPLLGKRLMISRSAVGRIKETQEMSDFCA